MTATQFWRDLESRFLKLNAVHENQLAANWTSTYWFEPGDQWKLSGGGPDSSVPGQFRILAQCGAIRLGYLDGATAESFWLDEMRRESPDFRGCGRSEGISEISEIGFIWSLCLASARFCLSCETKEILAMKRLQKHVASTRADIAALNARADLLWERGEIPEQEKLQIELAVGEGDKWTFGSRLAERFHLYEAFLRRSVASRCLIYKTIAEGAGNHILFSPEHLADFRARTMESVGSAIQVLQNRIMVDHNISGHPRSLPSVSSYARLHKSMIAVVDGHLENLQAPEPENGVGEEVLFSGIISEESRLAQSRRDFVMPLLDKKRWKRGKWATKAGVGKNSVYEYLDGKRKLSSENRQAMAQALDVEPYQLPE